MVFDFWNKHYEELHSNGNLYLHTESYIRDEIDSLLINNKYDFNINNCKSLQKQTKKNQLNILLPFLKNKEV